MKKTLPIPFSIAAMAGTFAGVVIALFTGYADGWLGVLIIGILAALFTMGFSGVMLLILGRYQDRIAAPAPITWDIRVNGVHVGTLSDADYAMAQLAAFQDVRTSLKQLLNVGHVFNVALGRLLVGIPLQLFWLGALFAMLEPEGLIDLMSRHQESLSNPATLVYTLQQLLPFLICFGALCLAVLAVFGYCFGYVNHFKLEAFCLIRHKLNIAVDGEMTLTTGVLNKIEKPMDDDTMDSAKRFK